MNPLLTRGSNLELYADSVSLKLLPLKDSVFLYKGDQVVVAECEAHSGGLVDSLWVKLAHSEEIQGWITQGELLDAFMPIDSISQVVHFLIQNFRFCFIGAVILLACLFFFYKRVKQLRNVQQIGGVYALLFCLSVSLCATFYASIQMFHPEQWQYYFFNPTLSPLGLPWMLFGLLCSVWGMLVLGLAAVEEAFRLFSPSSAMLYSIGLLSVAILCYAFFLWSVPSGIGYFFLILLFGVFIYRLSVAMRYKYCCGNCGFRLKEKGRCPSCGAWNN